MSTLARPKGMRGQLMTDIKRNMVVSTILATIGAYVWYVKVVKHRREVYADFHKNTDLDAVYERQKAKGVFTAFQKIEEYEAELAEAAAEAAGGEEEEAEEE